MASSSAQPSSSTQQSSRAQPSARGNPFIASVGELDYMWGGAGDRAPETVDVYNHDTETWTREYTKGPHPPTELCNGGCTISGQCLYVYGGAVGLSYHGGLYELNIKSWTWRKLCEGDVGGPGKKSGCRMISYQDQLLVVGGVYDKTPRSRQAGASYEDGRTNEVHSYNLTTGLWSSPSNKGSRLPPCSGFSLTMTEEDEAVMFGGTTPSGRSSKARVLHLPTMTWRQHKEGDPWPWRRCYHIAACLGYGGQHQRLLISGGSDVGVKYDDLWLLQPQSGGIEKVEVSEKYKKLLHRSGHGAAAVNVNSDCVEVIFFGGLNNNSLIGDTVVVRFEFLKTSSEGGKWSLTDIADHTQLGSPARLATKRRMIQSSSSQSNMVDTMVNTVRKLKKRLQASQIEIITLQKRAEELQTQFEDANRKAEDSHRRAEDSNRSAEESNKRAEESNQRAKQSHQRAEESNERAEESHQKAEESNQRAEESHQKAEESNQRAEESHQRAEESNQRAADFQRSAAALEIQLADSNRRTNELQTQVDNSNRRIDELQRQVIDSNRRAENAEERVQQMERSLAELRQSDKQHYQISSTHWAVKREEIELTGPDLGVGAWATVTVAKFRGAQVAVKRIHDQIISRHNVQLFHREMNIAARLRHPNLIQFIGATVEGEMMIILELMATSLRSQLETEEYFQPKLVKAISLDVALGLNYLHLIQPDPIVHRDISSANILLEVIQLNKWRAKLTDYGSVNVVRQLKTGNPGSPAYAAPEAFNPSLQSPKMDMYSFGALILEMLTGRLPSPEDRPDMFRKVQHEQLLCLIRRCLSKNPEDRPSASTIISEELSS